VWLLPLHHRHAAAWLTYEFAAPILASESVGKFWFEADEGGGSTLMVLDNGDGGYVLKTDEISYVSWFSTVRANRLNPQSPSFDLIFVAGVSTSLLHR
jgi:predicted secreted hydrolase